MDEPIAKPLPPTRRVVTGHNDDGIAIVKTDQTLTPTAVGDGTYLTNLWCSTETPADTSSDDDKALVDTGEQPKASAANTYDLPPRYSGLFHRTITLDYVVVLRGSIKLGLEDGSNLKLDEGDVVVQKTTMHSWSNDTDEWARVFGVMLPSNKPVVNGKELEASWPF